MSRSQKWDFELMPLSPTLIDEGLRLCEKATQVVGWYPHSKERDNYCTVRGPFGKWFKLEDVSPRYDKSVASAFSDVKFAAHAMTNYRDALIMIVSLQEEIADLKGSQDIAPLMEEFSHG